MDLYEARGFRGFWLGYIPSISRDVPFSGFTLNSILLAKWLGSNACKIALRSYARQALYMYHFLAIYWGCYEGQKKLFGYQAEQVPLSFSFMAGAVAGTVRRHILCHIFNATKIL